MGFLLFFFLILLNEGGQTENISICLGGSGLFIYIPFYSLIFLFYSFSDVSFHQLQFLYRAKG